MTLPGVGRLRWHEWLLVLSGVALFVVMFLAWFTTAGALGEFTVDDGTLDFTTDDGRRSAWQAFSWIDILLAATVVGALSLAVLVARGVRGEWARMLAGTVTALAFSSTVVLAIRVFLTPSLGLGPNVEVSSTPWAWIGLLACCLMTAGGAVSLRALRDHEEGTSAPEPGRGYSAHRSS